MTSPPDKCRECGGELVAGTVLDRHAVGRLDPALWVAGEIRTGAFTGKLQNETVYVLDASRCVACGTVRLSATRTP